MLPLDISILFVSEAKWHGRDEEVKDQRRREERILARVVHDDGVGAAHEDLRRVLVHCALRVTDVRHVLDDDAVVRVLVLAVDQPVGSHHVVHDVGLGDLLRAELRRGREVLAVVVAQVVVADDAGGLQRRESNSSG